MRQRHDPPHPNPLAALAPREAQALGFCAVLCVMALPAELCRTLVERSRAEALKGGIVTPGPWDFDSYNTIWAGAESTNDLVAVASIPDDPDVGENTPPISRDRWYPESAANARLISSKPAKRCSTSPPLLATLTRTLYTVRRKRLFGRPKEGQWTILARPRWQETASHET